MYSKVSGYKEFSRLALKEMYRQTGDELVFDQSGLLKRGLVIRLLVLPNDVGSIRESIEWIKDELSPRVAISLMAQYYPTHQGIGMDESDSGARRVGDGRRLGAGV
jgi:putative pyruvate formate lyase activating enzyme